MASPRAVFATDLLCGCMKLDGTGSSNMAVDGTSAKKFWHTSDENFVVRSVGIEILFAGTPTAAKFGDLSELANGCLVEVVHDDGTTVAHDFFPAEPWKRNADLILTGGFVFEKGPGTSDFVGGSWDMAKSTNGRPIVLQPGQRFQVTVRDDLSALTLFRMMARGHRD